MTLTLRGVTLASLELSCLVAAALISSYACTHKHSSRSTSVKKSDVDEQIHSTALLKYVNLKEALGDQLRFNFTWRASEQYTVPCACTHSQCGVKDNVQPLWRCPHVIVGVSRPAASQPRQGSGRHVCSHGMPTSRAGQPAWSWSAAIVWCCK